MTNRFMKGALPLIALTMAATPLAAQQSGLVNIDLSNSTLLSNIANNLNVNVSDIPVNLQVPVSVAAAICNVPVAILAQQKVKGQAACSPTATSAALNQAVLKSMKKQKQ